MTYGYHPEDWPAFQSELARRGIDSADIEKVELRPEHVVVTLRSGRVESWSEHASSDTTRQSCDPRSSPMER